CRCSTAGHLQRDNLPIRQADSVLHKRLRMSCICSEHSCDICANTGCDDFAWNGNNSHVRLCPQRKRRERHLLAEFNGDVPVALTAIGTCEGECFLLAVACNDGAVVTPCTQAKPNDRCFGCWQFVEHSRHDSAPTSAGE